MNRLLSIAAVFFLIAAAGCQNKEGSGEVKTVLIKNTKDKPECVERFDISDKKERVDLSSALNEFTFDIYRKLTSEKSKSNVFFSGFSVSSALSIVYAGSKGETENEMQNVLHYPAGQYGVHSALAEFEKRFDNYSKNENLTLTLANGLWLHSRYKFYQEYLDYVINFYSTEISTLDFGNAENAAGLINGWIEKKTNEKIKDILSPSAINDNTRMVIANTIYFNAKWTKDFNPNVTRENEWYNNDGGIEMKPFMFQSADFDHYENDYLKALEMPYADGSVSMLVLLPKEKDGIKELESKLTQENYSDWINGMQYGECDVNFPKFKFESEFSASEYLKELGMPSAFSNAADLSCMAPGNELKISDVIHKAFIEVTEAGTEAAASTVVTIETKGIEPEQEPPFEFRADHPFIFVIKDNSSNTILFAGRVMNPTQ